VRKIAPRKAAVVACATALMQVLSGAIAAPVDLGRFVYQVRKGYTDTVKVNIIEERPTADGGREILAIELRGINNEALRLPIGIQDGNVSEDDVKVSVYWLAQFPSENRLDTLSALIFYTKPTDPDFVNQFLNDTHLVKYPMDEHSSALFTAAGEQVSTIEGGDSASAGQTLDAFLEAISSLATEAGNQNDRLPAVVARSRDSLQKLTSSDIDEMVEGLQQFPSEPTNPNSPPLVSAADARDPALRQRLISDMLRRVTAGIQDSITEKRRVLGKEKQLLVSDIADAFKAAGVSDVDVSAEGDKLLITRGTGAQRQILAAGMKITNLQGRFYLSSSAIDSLQSQLEANWYKAMAPVLDQRGSRGVPAPDLNELDEALASLEKTMRAGSDPDPTRDPTDPNDPKPDPGSNPGDPDSPGEGNK
jgi:hypothetical protein